MLRTCIVGMKAFLRDTRPARGLVVALLLVAKFQFVSYTYHYAAKFVSWQHGYLFEFSIY